MDRLEAMSLLLETLDAGSFSAAARQRGMPVATLARKVGQLEEQLGATLLLRSTRRLALTDAGHRYVAGARAILAQVAEVERDAAGEFVAPTGRLVVSAPRMFGRLHVLPIVGRFLAEYPGISVDLRLADGNVDLAAGAADVAVRIGPLPDSSLVATRIGTMRLVTVASPRLFAHSPAPTRPRDLDDLPMIALDMPLPGMAPIGPTGPVERARLVVTSAEAAVDAAVAGLGIVRVLHYQASAALADGRLIAMLPNFEPEPAPVHLVHAPAGLLPLKTRRFLDAAGEDLRAVLRRLASAPRP